MSAWQAAQYVGGGLSLIAFVVATMFYAYRERLRGHASLIRSAPQEDRLEAIATVAEFIRVDVSKLRPEQQANIVLEQLRIRARRDFLLFWFFIMTAGICGFIAVTAIIMNKEDARKDASEYKAPPSPATPRFVCNDPPPQYPESDLTRVVSFTYGAPDPNTKKVSTWNHPTPDRWVEENSEGLSYFSVQRRTTNGFCDGTIATRLGEPNFHIFISDKNCVTNGFFFRRLPSCDWIGLPRMQNVH